MKQKLILTAWFLCIAPLFSLPAAASSPEGAPRFILSTTFPIGQIVQNLVQGREGVQAETLLPNQAGCPHDYILTPQDMQKLAKTEILVVNGLGMEEFLGAPVKKANPGIRLIDSASGIKDTLKNAGDHGHDHAHGHAHAHDHSVNPHLFVSPRQSARLASNIAAELAKADPGGAALYSQNAARYAETMNRLADDLLALGKRLKNKKIVPPHSVFDYLARDMGLVITASLNAHAQEPSAAEMKRLVKTIRDKKVGAILAEARHPDKAARTLSRETGVPVIVLDPASAGPANAPLDHYERIMRKNMEAIEAVLGGS